MVDLRSDTLTMPDYSMLETILTARLGDDGRTDAKGRGEDPTINRLEDMAAALVGKEAAILMPTGTFGNTIAAMTHCHAGQTVLVDEEQHMLLTEKFAFEQDLGRLTPVCYHQDSRHMPDPDELDKLLTESGASLICLENSHNFSGGYCIDLPTMAAIRKVADRHGVPIHMDGARLFHAAAHLHTTVKQVCQYVDTVMFCVSKGLGAPVGSLLCGTEVFCAKARANRKLFGGVMRQAGVVAAPAIYALEHNVERLTEDIENAQYVHQQLSGKLHKVRLQEEVQTNILMLNLTDAGILADEFCKRAKERGLLIRPIRNQYRVRLVFYKGITRKDAEEAAAILLALDSEL